jgi:hypothetical protein
VGYNHRVLKCTCGDCKKTYIWNWNGTKPATRLKCNCGAKIHIAPLPEWPDIPRSLYLGESNSRILKMYPLPPNLQSAQWAQPYSVRSFVYQASETLEGCSYSCQERGKVFDELVYSRSLQ